MRDDLATLVGSRICHDLISPIGAIGNGVELLELTGGESGSEIALISDSVQNANARIRYFRVAFGAAAPDQVVSRREVLAILAATARGGRMTYYWQVDGDNTRQDVRIAFLLLLCFETALPIGGDVSIQREDGVWTISTSSDRLNIDAERWESLTNPRKQMSHSPALVQFALLPSVLAESRRTLELDLSEGQITAKF